MKRPCSRNWAELQRTLEKLEEETRAMIGSERT